LFLTTKRKKNKGQHLLSLLDLGLNINPLCSYLNLQTDAYYFHSLRAASNIAS